MQGTVWVLGFGVDVEIIATTEATSCVRHTPFLKLNKDRVKLTD